MLETETKRCPYCGEIILATAIKCKHCKSILTDDPFVVFNTKPETYIKIALSKKFELLDEIGKGGMAVVYKALQKNLERVVALKILPQQFVHDQEFLEYFHREARAAAVLSHPNIVTIFDEGCENGIHYISMEFLEGIDLHNFIKSQGKLSVEQTVKIIAQIADSLDYAHKKGIIHRDVKSGNIIITTSGRAVLTDFGIARAFMSSKSAMSGSIIGTPEYMSPEQANGQFLDGRSDLFSLGVVLYECLAGEVPFKADNPIGVIYKIINSEPVPIEKIRSDLPDWLIYAVKKSLNKSPELRFQTGNEFSNALLNNQLTKLNNLQRKNKKGSTFTNQKEKQTVKIKNIEYDLRRNTPQGLILLIGIIISIVFITLFTMLSDSSSSTRIKNDLKTDEEVSSQTINRNFNKAENVQVEPSNNLTSAPNASNEIIPPNNYHRNLNNEPQSMVSDDKYEQIRGLLSQGQNYINENNWDDANRCFDRVLELEPENIDAINGRNQLINRIVSLGDENFQMGNYTNAINLYKKALNFSPNDIRIKIKLLNAQRTINNEE
jgi:serine/threonine protein kinase